MGIIQTVEDANRAKRQRKGNFALSAYAGTFVPSCLGHRRSWLSSLPTQTMIHTTGLSGSQTSQNYTPAFLHPSSQMADCGTCQPPDHMSQSPHNNFFSLYIYTSKWFCFSRKTQLTHSENIFSGCCLPTEDILIPRAWLGTLLICPKQANL